MKKISKALFMVLCSLVILAAIGTLLLNLVSNTLRNKQETTIHPETQAVQLKSVTLPAPPPLPTLTSIVPKSNSAAPKSSITAPKPTKTLAQSAVTTNESPQNQAQIYQQISAGEGLNIQLTWPQSSAQREALINYFYQCAGAEFALLHQQSIEILSPKRYRPASAWLRVANGYLSKQEQTWLNKGSSGGIPVRILPQNIDMTLSKHIAKHIGSEALRSLSAEYQLQSGQLRLRNIILNQQPVKGTWVLSSAHTHCN